MTAAALTVWWEQRMEYATRLRGESAHAVPSRV
jgi:hypothetical protein